MSDLDAVRQYREWAERGFCDGLPVEIFEHADAAIAALEAELRKWQWIAREVTATFEWECESVDALLADLAEAYDMCIAHTKEGS